MFKSLVDVVNRKLGIVKPVFSYGNMGVGNWYSEQRERIEFCYGSALVACNRLIQCCLVMILAINGFQTS